MFASPGGMFSKINLFDVVLSIEAFRGAHVPVPLGAVGRDHYQVQIVLQLRSRRIGPDQGDFQRSAVAEPTIVSGPGQDDGPGEIDSAPAGVAIR